mmetsp:Transcript_19222/g.37761  ORF Transcript_19222/g.37761 Transcript_19222/m.37761 type:complete len:302 (-) Transcript_19222:267-1172(-)
MDTGGISQPCLLFPPPGLEQYALTQAVATIADSTEPRIEKCWGEAWHVNPVKVPLNSSFAQTSSAVPLGSDSHVCDGMPWGKSAHTGWENFRAPQMQDQGTSTQATADAEQETYTCRWHKSAQTVGSVSEDGHVFSKVAGGQKVIMGNKGVPVAVSSICMVYDESLRCGGLHEYNYQILDGELGAADGAGFVFDSKVRRNNIQRMRSVFLNQKGCICLRNCERVERLGQRLPPLAVGMSLIVQVDLDTMYLRFSVFNDTGRLVGMADVSCEQLVSSNQGVVKSNSGFFCAVVTKDISVALN